MTLIPALERLAESGNAEAIYHIGMAYQTGSGVTEDHAKALAAFRKGEALGDPLASYKLGCYFGGQGAGLVAYDSALALKYKLVAAEAGYSLAQHDVGLHYARSDDLQAARIWLERAATQGFVPSLMLLSALYNGAPAIAPDPVRSTAYFRLALAGKTLDAKQTEWLKTLESRLSPGDRQRADDLVRDYHAVPTPLTVKALAGQRAAQALVKTAG
jgi:TPR repeat protein